MRALIVEDDLTVAEQVSQAMIDQGFDTDMAHDGGQGAGDRAVHGCRHQDEDVRMRA